MAKHTKAHACCFGRQAADIQVCTQRQQLKKTHTQFQGGCSRDRLQRLLQTGEIEQIHTWLLTGTQMPRPVASAKHVSNIALQLQLQLSVKAMLLPGEADNATPKLGALTPIAAPHQVPDSVCSRVHGMLMRRR